MAKLDLTYDLKDYMPAAAGPVDDNFKKVENYVNGEVIERDGTVAMRAQLKLAGDPISLLDAAPKQYVDQVLPIGIIMMYGGAGAPGGGRWMVCNGAELQSADYPDLYNILKDRFSPAGTPASRFNLPNLRDRVPMGAGTQTTVGETGGRRDTIVVSHHHGMGNHTHTINHNHATATTSQANTDHLHAIFRRRVALGAGNADSTVAAGDPASGSVGNADTGSSGIAHTHSLNLPSFSGNSGGPDDNLTGDTGTDASDANLPPFLGVQYIIRVK